MFEHEVWIATVGRPGLGGSPLLPLASPPPPPGGSNRAGRLGPRQSSSSSSIDEDEDRATDGFDALSDQVRLLATAAALDPSVPRGHRALQQ